MKDKYLSQWGMGDALLQPIRKKEIVTWAGQGVGFPLLHRNLKVKQWGSLCPGFCYPGDLLLILETNLLLAVFNRNYFPNHVNAHTHIWSIKLFWDPHIFIRSVKTSLGPGGKGCLKGQTLVKITKDQKGMSCESHLGRVFESNGRLLPNSYTFRDNTFYLFLFYW